MTTTTTPAGWYDSAVVRRMHGLPEGRTDWNCPDWCTVDHDARRMETVRDFGEEYAAEAAETVHLGIKTVTREGVELWVESCPTAERPGAEVAIKLGPVILDVPAEALPGLIASLTTMAEATR